MKNKITFKDLALLNALFLIYSFVGVLSKMASSYEYFSLEFVRYFIIAIIAMVVYAILWQISLRKIPLSIAYSNKAATLFWGLLWSVIIFRETLTIGILIGALMIVVGIRMVVKDYE